MERDLSVPKSGSPDVPGTTGVGRETDLNTEENQPDVSERPRRREEDEILMKGGEVGRQQIHGTEFWTGRTRH